MQLEYVMILIIIAVVITVSCTLRVAARIRTFRMARLRRRGRVGEDKAVQWLERNGYDVVETQSECTGRFVADGQCVEFVVRPDIIASRNGEEWVVEVKTGAATSLANRSTRRQIREYAALYPDHNMALFDAGSMELIPVEFDDGIESFAVYESSYPARIKDFFFGCIFGVAIVIAITMLIDKFVAPLVLLK